MRREAERLVLATDQRKRQVHLIDDLIVAADDVAVVLGQLPHAEHAGQRTGPLVAEEPGVVGQAHRQVAVGAQARLEDQHRFRAVHRLQTGLVFAVLEHEHVLLVEGPVAGGLP